MAQDGFASKLKCIREAAGLSQADLASKAGMNRFGVAKLEQGVREPTWATVQALAAALGVDCRAFAGDDGVGGGEAEEKPAKAKKAKKRKPAGK